MEIQFEKHREIQYDACGKKLHNAKCVKLEWESHKLIKHFSVIEADSLEE